MRKLEDAREVLRASEAVAGSATTKLAHRFLALTVVRPGVVATCPWDELRDLDADHWLWTVPAQRMKLRFHYKEDDARDHLVPLSRQALEVVEALKQLSSASPYVFPNDRWFHWPMSENALGYLLKRAGFQGRHVPHGWRASFSTIMNERRPADSKAIDRMLTHVPKDKIEAAYNRAEHLELRKEIAQEWADLLLMVWRLSRRCYQADGSETRRDAIQRSTSLFHQRRTWGPRATDLGKPSAAIQR